MVLVVTCRQDHPSGTWAPTREFVQISGRSTFAILAPAILRGGIHGSLFTPTGAVGTVGIYGLMRSLFIITCLHDTVLRLPRLAGYQG